MAATSYAAEQEGEVSLFQFQSPDMDMEPPHFVSGIHSATRGKRSRRSRHSLSLIPRSEIAAQQQDQEDQEQDQEDQEVQEEGGEAEEEMAARCLMMLLSDGSDRQSNSPTTTSSSESLAPSTLQPAIRRRIKKPKRFDVEDADSPYNSLEWDADLKQGMMVRLYACKSCNKKFSSFQALGGHRASCHYKSISVLPRLDTEEGLKENCSFYGPSVENNNKQNLCTETKKVRVHECPVCHRNFSSGQALGGHKRTHSTPVATNIHTSTSLSTTEQQQLLPPRGAETLDLNMPAEDVNDRTQMQHSSPVSVNLEGDLLDSTSWTHSDYKPISYNSSRPWWMESHQPGVIREDEADSQLGSNSGFVRGRDLGCKRAGLPLITTVN